MFRHPLPCTDLQTLILCTFSVRGALTMWGLRASNSMVIGELVIRWEETEVAYRSEFVPRTSEDFRPTAQGIRSRQSRGQYLTLRRLMSYIYGAPILDVSRSHTTTQHSQ